MENTLTSKVQPVWLVQYSILTKHYSVGFSTREEIYLAGSLRLPEINRIRRILNMKDLPPACEKCHAATLRACICDGLNGRS